jgi:hypothetical protein
MNEARTDSATSPDLVPIWYLSQATR